MEEAFDETEPDMDEGEGQEGEGARSTNPAV